MGDHVENKREARANPDKFLRERFENTPLTDVIVLKSLRNHERKTLHIAAGRSPPGIYHDSVFAPKDADGTILSVDRWLVVGRDRYVVREKIMQVSREAVRARQRLTEARETIIFSKMNASPPKDAVWDVGGLWDIKFRPSNKVGWANRDGKCLLDIRFAPCSGEGTQMWARFDFISMKGIFRFLKPDRDEGLNDFHLSVDDKPSPNRPMWSYCWRAYDGKVLKSEVRLGSVTFGGVDGTVLAGVFKFDSDGTAGVEFTDLKTSPTPRSASAE